MMSMLGLLIVGNLYAGTQKIGHGVKVLGQKTATNSNTSRRRSCIWWGSIGGT